MSVGLDIGSKTIKVVELSQDGDRFSLKAAGVVGYTGVEVDKIADDKEVALVAMAIRKLISDAKIENKKVSLSLPESKVFTRVINFPLLTDQEIASAVKWEAEQYIPIPIAEAIVQHQILERRENTSPPSVSVLLAAAPRVLVEKYIKVANSAGLEVISAESEVMSLVRALAPEKQTVMIADFGAHSTDLAIAKNGILLFSRSVPTAGEAFTRAVAQGLGVTPQQAEEYKRAYGLSKGQLEGKVGISLDPVFRIVSEEIKKAIHYYQSEEKGEAPTSLILSGGASGMPEASTTLAKLLGLEVLVGNPFARISVDPATLTSLAPYAPLYAVAVGLALRGE